MATFLVTAGSCSQPEALKTHCKLHTQHQMAHRHGFMNIVEHLAAKKADISLMSW